MSIFSYRSQQRCRMRYDKIVNRMSSSEATTRNIRVRVHAQYDPGRSSPQQSQWFFLYTVNITNESHDTVQLMSRHWIITDAANQVQEVRGPGQAFGVPDGDPRGPGRPIPPLLGRDHRYGVRPRAGIPSPACVDEFRRQCAGIQHGSYSARSCGRPSRP